MLNIKRVRYNVRLKQYDRGVGTYLINIYSGENNEKKVKHIKIKASTIKLTAKTTKSFELDLTNNNSTNKTYIPKYTKMVDINIYAYMCILSIQNGIESFKNNI